MNVTTQKIYIQKKQEFVHENTNNCVWKKARVCILLWIEQQKFKEFSLGCIVRRSSDEQHLENPLFLFFTNLKYTRNDPDILNPIYSPLPRLIIKFYQYSFLFYVIKTNAYGGSWGSVSLIFKICLRSTVFSCIFPFVCSFYKICSPKRLVRMCLAQLCIVQNFCDFNV